jgi:hypothetical protein
VKLLRARIKEGPLVGAVVTLTPDLLAACRNPVWNAERAVRLLREVIGRVGGGTLPRMARQIPGRA